MYGSGYPLVAYILVLFPKTSHLLTATFHLYRNMDTSANNIHRQAPPLRNEKEQYPASLAVYFYAIGSDTPCGRVISWRRSQAGVL